MEEELVLKFAQKSLRFETKSRHRPEQSNYDVFRAHVSKPIIQLFEMSMPVWRTYKWKWGVNLAVPMQAMFKPQSLAKLQSPRYSHLLKKYDGGSQKLASVIDVGRQIWCFEE